MSRPYSGDDGRSWTVVAGGGGRKGTVNIVVKEIWQLLPNPPSQTLKSVPAQGKANPNLKFKYVIIPGQEIVWHVTPAPPYSLFLFFHIK